MKLEQHKHRGINTIRAYTDSTVTINDETFSCSLVVTADSLQRHWAPLCTDDLQPSHIHELAKLDVEIILLGTGKLQQFPDPRLLLPLHDRGIGVEVMTTPAACRTYNILLAEDRAVAAALLLA